MALLALCQAAPGTRRDSSSPAGLQREPWPSFSCRVSAAASHRIHLVAAVALAFGILGVPRPSLAGWTTFNVSDGLGGNAVTAMLEASDGTLWFGTSQNKESGSITRYDGLSFFTFPFSADHSGQPPIGPARAILQDSRGDMWFGVTIVADPGSGPGMTSSLFRYDGREWSEPQIREEIQVSAIHEDRQRRLWFGTSNGDAFTYDGTTWGRDTTIVSGMSITSILDDGFGRLWFGTYGAGIVRFDETASTTYTMADGSIPSDNVTCVFQDRNGRIWVGTDGGGTAVFDGLSWTTYDSTSGLASNSVISIEEDRWGALWFGTGPFPFTLSGGVAAGVSRYDGVRWETFTVADGLGSNSVTVVQEDGSGNLWFCTSDGGVSRFDGTTWKPLDIPPGTSVNTILEDAGGIYWFGTTAGLLRLAGPGWTLAPADGYPGGNTLCGLLDHFGRIWFGTSANGVYRLDGGNWTNLYQGTPLEGRGVLAMAEDSAGGIWFGLDSDSGVVRYDEPDWRVFGSPESLRSHPVSAIIRDRTGRMWIGTSGQGVAYYDGLRFVYSEEFMPSHYAYSLLQDRSDGLWAGMVNGIARYDGERWDPEWWRFPDDPDFVGYVSSIQEDRSGGLWFATGALNGSSRFGAKRYKNGVWTDFTVGDGLPSDEISTILVDRSGYLWFGGGGGISRHGPDLVPPRTVLISKPPPVSATRLQLIQWRVAFPEGPQVEFSFCLDCSDSTGFSQWSPATLWSATVPNGLHRFSVRARDRAGNVEYVDASCSFEVDAEPPAPVLIPPQQALKGTVEVTGTAADPRFSSYRVEVQPGGLSSWEGATLLRESIGQVQSGLLAEWNTKSAADGIYDLRLSVSDSLGLVGTAQARVVIDNHFPFVEQTAPRTVTAASGGDLYTTNQELHLYFPPHAFDHDALVTIAQVAADAGLDSLSTGAARVSDSFDVCWDAPESSPVCSGVPLRRPATLEFSTAGLSSSSTGLAVYESTDASGWIRLGGTVEQGKISLAIRTPGRYAIFTDRGSPPTGASLSALSFTPRVFSVADRFANDHAAISFTLGRPAPVTVRIYNRAGRLVREVASGQMMNAGANLVRWDGRDRAGVHVADGLYLVTVEGLGIVRRGALAVVR